MRAAYAAALLGLIVGASAPVQANPWLGTWHLRIKPGEAPETLQYTDAGDGAMRMVSVETNSVIVTRFDGRPAADQGQTDGPARTLAIQWRSRTSYLWTFALDGVPFVQGLNTLVDDWQSFTEVAWRVTTPGKTTTLLYERR